MSLEKIETVENPLLERTEISALFDSKSGSLTRKEAIDLISKKARIDSSTVYAIKLSNSSGSILIDQLKGEVTARCHFIIKNAVTLGFVEDVIAGKISPGGARDEYAKRIFK